MLCHLKLYPLVAGQFRIEIGGLVFRKDILENYIGLGQLFQGPCWIFLGDIPSNSGSTQPSDDKSIKLRDNPSH